MSSDVPADGVLSITLLRQRRFRKEEKVAACEKDFSWIRELHFGGVSLLDIGCSLQ
jgi:hypothetical protein